MNLLISFVLGCTPLLGLWLVHIAPEEYSYLKRTVHSLFWLSFASAMSLGLVTVDFMWMIVLVILLCLAFYLHRSLPFWLLGIPLGLVFTPLMFGMVIVCGLCYGFLQYKKDWHPLAVTSASFVLVSLVPSLV